MAITRGSIDLTPVKGSFDSSMDILDKQITLRVQAENRIDQRVNSTEALLDLKVDRVTDTGDLLSNINAVADQISLRASQINFGDNTVADNLTSLNSVIFIDTVNSIVRIGRENENNIRITNNGLELNELGNIVAYLEGDRFKTGDAQITNLYMKTYDASTGSEIGALGWVMRSNGHLSLRRLR